MVSLKRIKNESRQFFTEQKAENIVGVMPGRFESDHYSSVIARENFEVKFLKALVIVGERESLVKNFAFSGLDKAVALVLGDIYTNQNHNTQILSKHFDVVLHEILCPESSCEMNRRAVSDLL